MVAGLGDRDAVEGGFELPVADMFQPTASRLARAPLPWRDTAAARESGIFALLELTVELRDDPVRRSAAGDKSRGRLAPGRLPPTAEPARDRPRRTGRSSEFAATESEGSS